MSDIIAALVVILAADAGLAALVDDRVFGVELPADQAAAMPRPAVVLQPSGGVSPVSGYAEITAQRIDAVAWAATPHRAEAVRQAVFAALKPVRRRVAAGVLVHWVEDAGGAFSGRDADTNWPAASQSFQCFYALQPVPA